MQMLRDKIRKAARDILAENDVPVALPARVVNYLMQKDRRLLLLLTTPANDDEPRPNLGSLQNVINRASTAQAIARRANRRRRATSNRSR